MILSYCPCENCVIHPSPDNVWVLESLQLLQQRDLSQDGHGDAVLGQREVHRLQRHDLARLAVARPVHRSVGPCK